MAILVNEETTLIVQGITGRDGSFHARQMLEYGTPILAGVTPGRGGERFDGQVPVFETVHEAVNTSGANTSVIYVPAPYAADAICEAAEVPIPLIVCITEGIPVLDMIRASRYVREQGVRLIGPNTPGAISPGKAKAGIIPGQICMPGPVGIVSRSGTLTYEIVANLTEAGIGQSTCLGIGGDQVVGTSFVETLALFEEDPETRAVILIGEIGGTAEQEAARFVAEEMEKPVVAFIAGRTAPSGRRMGHAGAIVAGAGGTAEEKIGVLIRSGIPVAQEPAELIGLVRERLEGER